MRLLLLGRRMERMGRRRRRSESGREEEGRWVSLNPSAICSLLNGWVGSLARKTVSTEWCICIIS
jgi:hypothetical protein